MLDQQSKINVEFKPSKRMKKRRELDALVGNGKTRRKSKTGHELLRSESESSEIDEFSLSTQKSLMRNKGQGTSCCSCLTVFGIFLVGTCLLACVALLWMHVQMKRDIDEMRDKMSTVESRNENGLGDYQDLQNKMLIVNKTVQGIKSLDESQAIQISKKLSHMTERINLLNLTAEGLKEGLKAAPELKQLSNKVPVISNTVANLGVNVKDMQTKVDTLMDFKKIMESELQTMNAAKSNIMPTTPPQGHSGVDTDFRQETMDKFDVLTESLAVMNSSLQRRLEGIQRDFSLTQAQFFENSTRLLSMQMTGGREGGSTDEVIPDHLEVQVHDLVHQMIVDMQLLNRTEADSKALDSLLTKMDNVTAIVQNLKVQFDHVQKSHDSIAKPDESDADLSLSDQLSDLRQDTKTQIEAVNKTLQGLLHDLGAISKTYLITQSRLLTMSTTVEGLKNYMGMLESRLDQSTAGKQDKSTTVGRQITTSTPKPEVSKQSTARVADKTANRTTVIPPTPQDESKTTLLTTTPLPLVHIPNINNFDELELNFRRWDIDGNELVLRTDLDGFMPDVPSEKLLKPYDANNDGQYTLEEFAAAMGFEVPQEPTPAIEPETNEKPPPR